YRDCGGKSKESFQVIVLMSFSGLVRAIIHLKDIDRDIRKASRLVIARAIFQLKDMGQRH
ncbi:unnamed protein product, partial [Brassica oleracea var. botrytis]